MAMEEGCRNTTLPLSLALRLSRWRLGFLPSLRCGQFGVFFTIYLYRVYKEVL